MSTSTRRSKRIIEQTETGTGASTDAVEKTAKLARTTVKATTAETTVTKKTSPAPAPKADSARRKRQRVTAAATPDEREGKSRTYAPPEKYAHLNGVPDALAPGLVLLLVGLNPGITTATVGHAYSNKTNRFWRYLHSSGLTPPRVLSSLEDQSLPLTYSLGLTNLIPRPTADQAELSRAEMDAAVPLLEDKIRRWRPEAVCIVGKGIWESVYRTRYGGRLGGRGWEYGWQEGEWLGGVEGEGGEGEGEGSWQGARVFVVPSTSGLVTINQEKMRGIWKVLGDWVAERRAERGLVVPVPVPGEVEK